MWVFCGGMLRSASTLQFQITSRLVTEAGIGQQIGWIDADQTLLHINHIDSARPDRWRSDLTPEAVAAIEQGVADWCDRHGYNPGQFIHQPQYI